MVKASEEGQGPPRAVEPVKKMMMMMMMMMTVALTRGYIQGVSRL
jgi:hypothetical protein